MISEKLGATTLNLGATDVIKAGFQHGNWEAANYCAFLLKGCDFKVFSQEGEFSGIEKKDKIVLWKADN